MHVTFLFTENKGLLIVKAGMSGDKNCKQSWQSHSQLAFPFEYKILSCSAVHSSFNIPQLTCWIQNLEDTLNLN
jgi:hypothetical protein